MLSAWSSIGIAIGIGIEIETSGKLEVPLRKPIYRHVLRSA